MKTKAIVMNVVRHGDQTVVAHLFTRAFGMMPFVVRRPASGRGNSHAAMLQPLTQLDIECQPPVEGRMQRLVVAELDGAYQSLPFCPHKTTVAIFLVDVLCQALRHEQPSDALYEFLSLSLRWFDAAEENYANFHLIFLLQLTRYMGYDPSLLPEAEALQVERLMRHNYRTMRLLALNGTQRSYFLHRLVEFYQQNVPSFQQVRSLEVIEDIYAN